MTFTSISGSLSKLSASAWKVSLLFALLIATLTSVTPAQAQSSDTWKSVAIIGGSTAAGAYIGHRVAGSTGTYIGAAAGAAAGYAIDRHRRNSEYNNGYYGNNNGYYGPNDPYGNGGYYGNNYPPDNGGYYGGPAPYPNGFRSNNFKSSNSRRR